MTAAFYLLMSTVRLCIETTAQLDGNRPVMLRLSLRDSGYIISHNVMCHNRPKLWVWRL